MLTLALGVAAATAVLGVVYTFLFQPFSFDHSDRLLMLASGQPATGANRLSVTYPDYEDWVRETDVFEETAIISNSRSVTMTGDEKPEHLEVELVSGNYFDMLGVGAAVGRVFSAEDDLRPGGHPLVVLSHDLWERRFGGDPGVVGRQLLLNDVAYTVIGVLDPVYKGTWWDPVDLWIPSTMVTAVIAPDYLENRQRRWLTVMARLRPGVSKDEAVRELNAVAEELERLYPKTNQGYRVSVFTLPELYYEYTRDDLVYAFWASLALLVLCCVNIAGLMLTRATARRREVAVRSALGAGRGRIIAEQIGEALLLAFAGGVVGILLALAITHWLVSLSTLPTLHTDQAFFRPMILVAAVAGSILAGIFFSIGPTLRVVSGDPWRFLKQGAKNSPSLGFRRLLHGVAVAEVALAVLILLGAGLAVGQYWELRDADVGYAKDDLLTMRLDLSSPAFQEEGVRERFGLRLLDEVESLPAVVGAGLVGPWSPPQALLYTDITVEDRLADSIEDAGFRTYRQYVSSGYFQVVDIPLLQGREFTDEDNADSPLVAIVSKPVADRAWPGESPIGKRFRRGLPGSEDYPWITVVGVVAPARNRGPKDFGKGLLDIYMPLLQEPASTPKLMVRASSEAAALGLAGPVRKLVNQIDPDVPVYNVETMKTSIVNLAMDERFFGILLMIFAGFAVSITAVGIYGVTAYGVRQRTREIGVRVALGASSSVILRRELLQGVVVLAIGVLVGGFMTYFLGQTVFPRLSGAFDQSPAILVVVLLAVTAFTLVAIVIPALRAASVTPTKALRYE